MYVCGVTVYDLCHIGHARSNIVYDILTRHLRSKNIKVKYIRNFTDIDDKIIVRANEMDKDPAILAQENIDAFHEDMKSLDVLDADIEPRATQYIDNVIQMIKKLIGKGFAYLADGSVYYSVKKFPTYGSLSGRKIEDMEAGSRIDINEKKKHPMDFVLWKSAKPNEPQWDSPWGSGRPGWHIECSVMSNFLLGPSFDIHGGGQDLLFPHHENERAQSVAANGVEFARYWIHNGFVTVNSEKMSKSKGNFVTIREALKKYPGEVIRLFLLSKHYRSPVDYSKKDVSDTQSGLIRIYRTIQRLRDLLGDFKKKNISDLSVEHNNELLKQFINFMDDDLNTAGAVGLIFEKIKDLNRMMDQYDITNNTTILRRIGFERDDLFTITNALGIIQNSPESFFNEIASREIKIDEGKINKMIKQRNQARKDKDWAKADQIRVALLEMQIILEDSSQGTVWRPDV